MSAGQTYRYAERTLRVIAGQRMSRAGWQRYEQAILGMRLALDTGAVDEVAAVTEALATLGIPRQKAAADPYRTGQPRHLRPLTDELLQDLAALAADHPAA